MDTIKNIYCIGRNYVAHAHELGNAVPKRPVVFSKPTHSLTKANDQTITLPKDKGNIHFETELVIKIDADYYEDFTVDEMVTEMTVGLDLTMRELQNELKEKQHPWLIAKGFPNAAIVGDFIPFPGEASCQNTVFKLTVNDETRQIGDIKKMIFPLYEIIQFIGENLGLKAGDIIFTGTPEGVASLQDDDRLELLWGNQSLGKCHIQLS